uniref:Uncharacterized protein n=1 Tax=Dictyoglomus turgidum TaxID=513050 RepID=A0A7C3WV25_9BACT
MNQPVQQNLSPKVFQQGEFVVNPADGKEYQVYQHVPGKGVTLIDPATQQQVMVSEQNSVNLKPSIKTSSHFSVEKIAEEILEKLLNEKLPKVSLSFREVNKEVKNMRKDWNTKRSWLNMRKQLKTFSQMSEDEIATIPTYLKESRQDRAIKELGFNKEAEYSPYKGDLIKEVGRDRKTGIPMRGGDDIEVGLTEFPKDVDKSKNPKGYGELTMEEMDRKFEEERPHFKNEQYLPDYTKKREESTTYLSRSEKNKKIKDLRKDFPEQRYASSIEIALDQIIGGFSKSAQDSDIEELPIQYKEVKKAPKLEEYVEPEVLKEADPNVKTAIDLFKDTQSKIEQIQQEIKKKTEPLQQAIIDATKELNEELVKNVSLLKSCLDMIYQELKKTQDKVAVLEDDVYALVEREKAVAPSATLAQILKKAQEINPKIVEEINKIKALIEGENTKLVLERFLYKYPVSEVQKKKISTSADDSVYEDKMLFDILKETIDIVEKLKDINSKI